MIDRQPQPESSSPARLDWRANAIALWSSAVRLERDADAYDSAVREASEYFGLAPSEVIARMANGSRLLAEEWQQMKIDPRSESDLRRFYNENTAEAFELLNFNTRGAAGLQYVAAFEMTRLRPGRRYLDFGSGVGSGAILFARQGFEVTLADVSTPLLRFAEWRLRKRGLSATYVDLKQQPLPLASYDVATAFDVLEHVLDPLRAVADLWDSLTIGGILCFNTPFEPDPDKPMHIFHDETMVRRVRSAGFAWHYGAMASISVVEKVPNPAYRRWFFRLYDDYLSSFTGRIDVGRIRRLLLREGTARHGDP